MAARNTAYRRNHICICPTCLRKHTRGRSPTRKIGRAEKPNILPDIRYMKCLPWRERETIFTRCRAGGRPKKIRKRDKSLIDKQKLIRCLAFVNRINSDRPWKERWSRVARMYFDGQKYISKRKSRLLYDFYRSSVRRRKMDDGDAKLDEENISIECTRNEAGNETENHSSKISPLLAELINAEKRSKDEEESRDRTTEQKQEKLHTMQENLKVRDTDSGGDNQMDSDFDSMTFDLGDTTLAKELDDSHQNDENEAGTINQSKEMLQEEEWRENERQDTTQIGRKIEISARKGAKEALKNPFEDTHAIGDPGGANSGSTHQNSVWNSVTSYVASVCSKITCDIAEKYLGNSRTSTACKSSVVRTFQLRDQLEVTNSAAVTSEQMHDEATLCQTEHEGGERDAFAGIGITNETLNILSDSNIHPSGMFTADIPSDITISLPAKWKEFIGKEKLIGNWTKFFAELIKQHNPHCTLVFKGNHVSSFGSRKRNSPFMKGYAVCAHRPTCSAEVHFSVDKNSMDNIHLRFTGRIKHDLHERKSRKISGELRNEAKKLFEKNPGLPPSDVYRKGLANLTPDEFAAGNRTDAGGSVRVVQGIKNEVSKEHRDIKLLHNLMKDLQEKLRKEDEDMAKQLKHASRKLFGYIQSMELVPEIKLVLLHEPLIRLYHGIAPRDIIYFDATGSVVRKMPQFKRILYYSLCVRHPYEESPPLPVAEYVSSSHTTESIRRMITTLREKERLIFGGKCVQPALILTDNSLAMIMACLSEFNQETVKQYIDRTFDIVCGKASADKLSLTFLHICYAHVMKNNKTMLDKFIKNRPGRPTSQVREFSMRFFARLVECRRLEELEDLVGHGYVVFNSKFLTSNVTTALSSIERSINEYPQVYEALDDLEKKSEEQKEEDYEENDSQAQMNDEESLINTGSEEANINVFWNRCIQNSLHKTVTKLPFKEAPILNIYHNPMYFKYLREKKLPTVTLWTNLCLGDLSRFNEIYDIRAPTTAARSIRTQNRTSGQIEGFFSVLKRDVSALKLPLDHFVGRLWSNHKGLRRQYADGLWSGSCDKKKNSKDSSTTKSKKRVGKSENEDDLNTYSNIEETWNKTTPKRKKNTSFGAYRPGQAHVEFEPHGPHHKSKTTPIQEMLAFYAFRDQTWKTEGPTSPTIAHCINSIQRKWRRLSQNEKEEFFDERDAERLMKSPCLCNFTYEQRPDAMVMCDLCKVWFHQECLGIEESYAEAAMFYHCEQCIFGNFHPFLRYLSHYKKDIPAGNKQELIRRYLEWNKKSIGLQNCIERLDVYEKRAKKHCRRVVYSRRGIENDTGTTCFMNAVLQVLCGSVIFQFLPTDSSSNIVKALVSLHNELKEANQDHLRDTRNKKVVGSEVGFSFENPQQMCASEFLGNVLTKIGNDCSNASYEDAFFPREAELLICRSCGGLEGMLNRPCLLRTRVPEWKESIALKHLLWDAAACQYSIQNEGPGCNCQSSKQTPDKRMRQDSTNSPKQGMFYNMYMLLDAPSVLVIETNRVVGGAMHGGGMIQGRINKTLLNIEEYLELKTSTATEDSRSVTYRLCASVNLYARNQYSGHNYATIFDDDGQAFTFDDTVVSVSTTRAKLRDPEFRARTFLLFYIRESHISADSSGSTECHFPWDLQEHAYNRVVQLWLGDSNLPSTNRVIDMVDLNKTIPEQWINETIVNAFIGNICSQKRKLNVTSTSTYFVSALCSGRKSIEVKNIIADRTFLEKNDLVIVPIHHKDGKGGNLHWTVAGVFPHLKLILHCDSMQGSKAFVFSVLFSFVREWHQHYSKPCNIKDWIFLNCRDVSRQRNGYDCGAYACLNSYNLLHQELWLADRPETITKIRVWIASMALNAPKVVGNTDNKQGLAIPIELALVKRSEIVEELPDQCPGENIFQRLARNLATSKMPTASHCHEKLEAMDPVPKNASSKTDNILTSSSTKQTGPSCQAGPSDEDEFTSIIDHLVEDQIREENYPDDPLDFSEGTSAGDDTSVDFGQLTKQFARERSDSDDTDEELTDDDELAQSFQKNKIPVLKRIGNARKDFAAGTLVSERLAAILIQKRMFLQHANEEQFRIVKYLGQSKYASCLSYIRKMFIYYRTPSEELFDYGGYEHMQLRESFSLARENFYRYILMPELLANYIKEENRSTIHTQLFKCLFGADPTCFFHIGILLKDIKVCNVWKMGGGVRKSTDDEKDIYIQTYDGSMTQDFCHAKCAFIGNNLELTEQMKKTLGQGYQSIESQVNEKRKQGELSLGEIVALDLTEIPGRYLLLMVKQDDTSRKQTLKKTAESNQEMLAKFMGMANELLCRSISLPDIYICNNKGQRDNKKTATMFLTAIFKFLEDNPRSNVNINVFRIKTQDEEFVNNIKGSIKRLKERV